MRSGRDFVGELFEIEVGHRDDEYWSLANLDHFGMPKGFAPCDPGWQLTGRRCSLNIRQARAGVNKLAERYPDIRFRLVRRKISWHTTVVFETGPAKAGRSAR